MTIKLISESDYKELLFIFNNFKELTLQNKGYETINKSLFNKETNEKLIRVNSILNKSIRGFSEFSNFRLTKDNQIQIRFQYNYNYDNNHIPFIGVGYILLEELFKGFKNN